MPKKGQAHVPIRDVRVRRNGKDWTASYHTEDGKLMVWGAWGSRSEPIGRTKDLKSAPRRYSWTSPTVRELMAWALSTSG